jgi:uncharacterized protein YgiM (DUF1202 family)
LWTALLLAATGCTLTNTGGNDDETVISGVPIVTIASPAPNATFLVGVPVNIQASISNAGEDINRVEVSVDGTIIASLQAPNANGTPVFSITQTWPAAGSGPHRIDVIVYRGDGSSSVPDPVTINVVAETVEPTATSPTSAQNTGDSGNQGGGPSNQGGQATATTRPQPTDEPQPTAVPASDTPSVPMARTNVGINVRSGPGTNFAAIGQFAANTATEVLAVNLAGDWYKVRYQNGEGWVFGNLVTIEGDASNLPREAGPPTPVPPPPTAVPVPTSAPSTVNLTVIEPFIDPPQPQCRQNFTVGMTIRNDSTVATTIGLSRIQDVHVASGTVAATSGDALVAVTLQPGGTHRVTFTFNVSVYVNELHRIEFIADVNNQVAETNENDNRIGVQYTLPANC